MFSAEIREKSIGKMRFTRLLAVLLVPAVVLILGAAAPELWAYDDEDEIPFDVAKLYFELNDTDGDLGIHGLVDGDAWKSLEIEDPRDRKMLNIWVRGRLGRQGLTELFFESAEPPFEAEEEGDVFLPPEKFFRRFPQGWYEIEGMTLDGEERESKVWVSHVMPAPPGNIYVGDVPAAEDCDEGEVPSVSGTFFISWDPVTESHPDIGKAGPINVAQYQFVVEREADEDAGLPALVYSVDLPANVTEFPVPVEFIELPGEFKFEILVRATNGNQTAVESCFEIED